MVAGIRQILLISTPQDIGGFERLFGDGSQLGLSIQYAVQAKPEGLAQAFVIGREFVDCEPVALVLGDNLFYGQGFLPILARATERSSGGRSPATRSKSHSTTAWWSWTRAGGVVSIEEKRRVPKSPYAVPGL